MTDFEGPGGIGPIRSLRRVDLLIGTDAIMAVPATGEKPFPIPSISRRFADFLSTICEYIWKVHGRCTGMLLLLDVISHEWSFHIPPQRAGRRGTSWAVSQADLVSLPERLVVAGSFQTRLLEPDEFPASAVSPSFRGIHGVRVIDGERRRDLWFISMDGVVHRFESAEIIRDDMYEALRECHRRLKFD